MNIVETVRVRFTKTGRAKYISHLDLMRTMTRVLRRAAIPLWYTEGFSKHPYITFAAPLSLGYEGLCEYMDFRLEEDMPMEEIVDRLNRNMPEGITVVGAAPAQMKVAKIAASRWQIRMKASAYDGVQAVLGQDVIEVQKRTKKKTFKTIDIKPFIQNAELSQNEECCELLVTLPTGSDQAINPSLLLQAIFGDDYEADITRLSVLMESGEIFS